MIYSKINNINIKQNEPMAAYTTLGVGGPADYFIGAYNTEALSKIIKLANTNSIPWMIIGDGSNLLVSDKGIRGCVIHLEGDFESISINGNTLKCGSSAKVSKIADEAARQSLSGLEGVGTVPGSVGGAVVMNAGTHRGYIDEVITKVCVIDSEGESKELSKRDCGFAYRESKFQNDKSLIITFVEMLLKQGDGKLIANHLAEVRKHRQETQPQGKSAGCFFKNPENNSAGRLIEKAGCKGMKFGGAVVSDIHCNFIMNSGNASAADLWHLSQTVKQKVLDSSGIELEYEVRLIGEW